MNVNATLDAHARRKLTTQWLGLPLRAPQPPQTSGKRCVASSRHDRPGCELPSRVCFSHFWLIEAAISFTSQYIGREISPLGTIWRTPIRLILFITPWAAIERKMRLVSTTIYILLISLLISTESGTCARWNARHLLLVYTYLFTTKYIQKIKI